MLGGVDGSVQDRERVDELNTLRGRVVALTAELRGVKGSLDITTSFQSMKMCSFLCETRMHIHTSNFTITGVWRFSCLDSCFTALTIQERTLLPYHALALKLAFMMFFLFFFQLSSRMPQ